MKKFVAIPLVAVMLTALAVPVLAEENTGKLTTTTEPTQIDVFGKRDTDTTGAGTVYSVDIKWEICMLFIKQNEPEPGIQRLWK